jgi:hypothetical protein
MAVSLVPVLLSLLASLAPSSTTGNDLVVRVVDKDGKPVGGAPVTLVEQHRGFGPMGWRDFPSESADSRAEDGRAMFQHLDVTRAPDEHTRYVLRLGIPARESVEASVDPKNPPASAIDLVVPDCGSVVLHLPVKGAGHLQLRRAIKDEPPGARFWYGSEPPRAPQLAESVRFERVGLGIEIEYRVVGEELPTPLQGTFVGPTKKGETIEYTVKGLEGCPELLATLVDGDRKPIDLLQFDWSIGISSGNSFGWDGGHVRSDAQGRVRIPLTGAQTRPGPRRLELKAWSDDASAKRLGDAYVFAAVPADFEQGECDLGELIVVPFGSPKRFARLDDEALRRAFDAPHAGTESRASRAAGDAHEEMLCEMIRRGGKGSESFLTEHLQVPLRQDGHARFGSVDELALRTALSRMRREPDPLEVVLERESVLEVEFPDQPTIQCSLKNNQRGEWSLRVPDGGGPYGCGFEVTDSKGTRLKPESKSEGPGGMYTTTVLAPGAMMPLAVDFGHAIYLPRAGEYRVRVHYSTHEDLGSLGSMQGRMVASSPEFTVRIRPCTITLTKARMDQLRAAVRALDLKKTLPLVNWHWRSTLMFKGEAIDPEDVLFRAGREALPALFEALEDAKLEPERRAWVFAMLWNILGGNDPSRSQWSGVIGPSSWSDAWPTSSEAATSFGHTERRNFGKIDAAKQSEFTKLWLEAKSNYELKLVP